MAYADESKELLAIAEKDTDAIADALEAGASDIDAAFYEGGYVVPIDLSALTEPTKTRLTAKLKVVNRHLAARVLASGSLDVGPRGQPSGVQRDYDEAMKWLDRVRKGSVAYSGLAPLSGATGISVVGDAIFDHDLVEDVHNVRNLPELAGEGPADVPI